MALPFPQSDQFQIQFCFFSPLQEHLRRLIDLNQSILLQSMDFLPPLSLHQLASLLCARYGGDISNWTFTPVSEGMLLKLPNWLSPVQLGRDAVYWESQHYLRILPWQSIKASYHLPPSFNAPQDSDSSTPPSPQAGHYEHKETHSNISPPYIPPWRRRGTGLGQVEDGSCQKGVPAVPEGGGQNWSMEKRYAPGSGNSTHNIQILHRGKNGSFWESAADSLQSAKNGTDGKVPKIKPFSPGLKSCLTNLPKITFPNNFKTHPNSISPSDSIKTSISSPLKNTLLPTKTPPIQMADMTSEDEALIRKFIDLRTDDQQEAAVLLPERAATTTNWGRCLLAKVITSRTVLDFSFSSWMIKSWGSDPSTGFKQVAKACYLVEFVSVGEKNKVHSGGPWAFRGDIVATRLVSSHLDLCPDRFNYVDLWVQFYNVPINAVNEEGLDIIGEIVGTPVSFPIEGFSGGRKFIKMKIKVDIREPLKDKEMFTHQNIGDF